jgi:dienelactone hydrolase
METSAYTTVVLRTIRGAVELRLYEAPGATAGSVFVGGVGGGFDSPARGLFPRLCEELRADGLAAARVRFRHPSRFDEALHDIAVGMGYLRDLGVRRLALAGHSFGAAVALTAGAADDSVATVVALSTQSFGTEAASALSPKSLLLVHGLDDEILPAWCSRDVFRRALEPKRLELLAGTGHGLCERAEEVHVLVRNWIRSHLIAASPRPENAA